MLIRPDELAAIRAGEIDLAFRRWDRPRLRVGTRMRTAVGLIAVTSVDVVPQRALTAEAARRAGAPSAAALRRALSGHPDRPIHRIGLRWAGADPRTAMRHQIPDAAEIARLIEGLDRLDAASPAGPWTRRTLRLIDEHPAVRAPDLAAQLDRDTPSFKRDVRKLKERSLTESLDIGYRLSPRGAAVLDHSGLGRHRPEPEPGTPLPRIGAPATRALTAEGLTRLEQLTAVTEADVAALHGVGPRALRILREALNQAGLSFAAESQPLINETHPASEQGSQARELIDRIRAWLPGGQVREVSMFGAIAFMVDDAMAVAVRKDGSLLVRVDPAEDPRLLQNPAASRAEMGAGRPMGEGWIRVEAPSLRSDAALVDWLEAATRYLAQRKT